MIIELENVGVRCEFDVGQEPLPARKQDLARALENRIWP